MPAIFSLNFYKELYAQPGITQSTWLENHTPFTSWTTDFGSLSAEDSIEQQIAAASGSCSGEAFTLPDDDTDMTFAATTTPPMPTNVAPVANMATAPAILAVPNETPAEKFADGQVINSDGREVDAELAMERARAALSLSPIDSVLGDGKDIPPFHDDDDELQV